MEQHQFKNNRKAKIIIYFRVRGSGKVLAQDHCFMQHEFKLSHIGVSVEVGLE